MPNQKSNIRRRDLFRLAGAATVLSTGAADASMGFSPGPVAAPARADLNDAEPDGNPLHERQRVWFNEAKFGMFIHWGPVSLASVEISWPIMEPSPAAPISENEYINLYKNFNPVQYDPDAWVKLAREAGQRYMVLVTKHHDGFCMFDTAFSDYKITNTPYKKDIVRMLGEACARQNMPLGYYYSPPDMHHPCYRDTSKPAKDNWHGEPTRPEWPIYLDYMQLQLRELMYRYSPPVIFWFDGLNNQEKYDGHRVVRMIRTMSPRTLVNNRIGVAGDFGTPEQFVPDRIPVKGVEIQGTDTAQQQHLPAGLPRHDELKTWETCMTINETWAYNKNDTKYKSTQNLIRTLVEVASKGGNLLLNVGPTPDGTIQPEFQERLRGIGRWLAVNGDSIYGTTFGPLQNLQYGRTTAKRDVVYLHIFDWPANGKLEFPELKMRVREVRLLAGSRPVVFSQSERGITLTLPAQAPDTDASVVALRG